MASAFSWLTASAGRPGPAAPARVFTSTKTSVFRSSRQTRSISPPCGGAEIPIEDLVPLPPQIPRGELLAAPARAEVRRAASRSAARSRSCCATGRKAFAMNGARAMWLSKSFEVQFGGVALVPGEAVAGVLRLQPHHDAVARDLGQDAGGGDALARPSPLTSAVCGTGKGRTGRPSIKAWSRPRWPRRARRGASPHGWRAGYCSGRSRRARPRPPPSRHRRARSGLA